MHDSVLGAWLFLFPPFMFHGAQKFVSTESSGGLQQGKIVCTTRGTLNLPRLRHHRRHSTSGYTFHLHVTTLNDFLIPFDHTHAIRSWLLFFLGCGSRNSSWSCDSADCIPFVDNMKRQCLLPRRRRRGGLLIKSYTSNIHPRTYQRQGQVP